MAPVGLLDGDVQLTTLARQIEKYSPSPDAKKGPGAVFRTGEPELFESLTAADLVSMNESFVRARTIFDRMMEESLARHNECNGRSSSTSSFVLTS